MARESGLVASWQTITAMLLVVAFSLFGSVQMTGSLDLSPAAFSQSTTADPVNHNLFTSLDDAIPALNSSDNTLESICGTLNSPSWLESRHWNVDDGTRLLPDDDNQDYLQHILPQSLCFESSRFRNPVSKEEELMGMANTTLEFRQEWTVRLLYLGMHLHQHEGARQEILHRKSQGCPRQDDRSQQQFRDSSEYMNPREALYPPSSTDFECPDAKLLVSSMSSVGMGATVRMGAVPMFLAAMSMNRTLVFLNKAPRNMPHKTHEAWELSGCPTRKDFQCYFLPITPCMPSYQDLKKGVKIREETRIQMQTKGSLEDDTADKKRIVLLPLGMELPQLSLEGRERIGKHFHELISKAMDEGRVQLPSIIRSQLNEILLDPEQWEFQPVEPKLGFSYNRGKSLLHAAALLYLLRPNKEFQGHVDRTLQRALPTDYAKPNSFGLPIRASDKCQAESVCLLFEEYMELVMEQRSKYMDNLTSEGVSHADTSDIILTTESRGMMESRNSWPTNSSFPFRFLVNDKDTQQGTGFPRSYNHSQYEVMVSSIVAIKMQLSSRHFVGHCCSSFHHIMLDLFKVGCSPHWSPTFHCLQELPEEKYHLCCQWHRGKFCRKQRSAYFARRERIGEEAFNR